MSSVFWKMLQRLMASRFGSRKPLSPEETIAFDRDLESSIAAAYERNAARTPKQRRRSLLRVAKRLGFASNDYREVCTYLDKRYKGL